MRLQGQVAVITGAAGGIGREHALRFAAEGARVAVLDVNAEGAEETARLLTSQGNEAFAVSVDVSSTESCDESVAAVLSKWNRVDVLVNNAAIYANIDHTRHDPAYLEQVLSVNMLGPWRMSRPVVLAMIAQHSGRIINQSSDAAYMYNLSRPSEELPSFAYAWSKWAVNGLTKFMAGSLGPHGITVNCISPGLTMTDATRNAVSEKMVDRLTAATPLRRAMQPGDIAATAVWLASDEAAAVTGQIICVDGGAVMPG